MQETIIISHVLSRFVVQTVKCAENDNNNDYPVRRYRTMAWRSDSIINVLRSELVKQDESVTAKAGMKNHARICAELHDLARKGR